MQLKKSCKVSEATFERNCNWLKQNHHFREAVGQIKKAAHTLNCNNQQKKAWMPRLITLLFGYLTNILQTTHRNTSVPWLLVHACRYSSQCQMAWKHKIRRRQISKYIKLLRKKPLQSRHHKHVAASWEKRKAGLNWSGR